MIQLIGCYQCGAEQKGLPFFLQWRHEDKLCRSCGQDNSKYKEYHFCSEKCLKKFIDKFIGHEHKWKEHPGLKTVGEKYKVLEFCDICGITKWEKNLK